MSNLFSRKNKKKSKCCFLKTLSRVLSGMPGDSCTDNTNRFLSYPGLVYFEAPDQLVYSRRCSASGKNHYIIFAGIYTSSYNVSEKKNKKKKLKVQFTEQNNKGWENKARSL